MKLWDQFVLFELEFSHDQIEQGFRALWFRVSQGNIHIAGETLFLPILIQTLRGRKGLDIPGEGIKARILGIEKLLVALFPLCE